MGLSPLLESLIVLRFAELDARIRRVLSVMKLRDSDFDSTLVEFEISHKGLRVRKTLANAEALLTGVAHVREKPAPAPRKKSAPARKSRTR
jgi:circadian clock protein KaiC